MLRSKGTTNLGEYYLRRAREKDEAQNKNQYQNLMIPPSLMGQDYNYRGGMTSGSQAFP